MPRRDRGGDKDNRNQKEPVPFRPPSEASTGWGRARTGRCPNRGARVCPQLRRVPPRLELRHGVYNRKPRCQIGDGPARVGENVFHAPGTGKSVPIVQLCHYPRRVSGEIYQRPATPNSGRPEREMLLDGRKRPRHAAPAPQIVAGSARLRGKCHAHWRKVRRHRV